MKEKLLSYLERKDQFHPLVRNEIDQAVANFVARVEATIELYARTCAPLLEGNLPVPALVRQKRDELVREMEDTEATEAVEEEENDEEDEDDNEGRMQRRRRKITATTFAYQIRGVVDLLQLL